MSTTYLFKSRCNFSNMTWQSSFVCVCFRVCLLISPCASVQDGSRNVNYTSLICGHMITFVGTGVWLIQPHSPLLFTNQELQCVIFCMKLKFLDKTLLQFICSSILLSHHHLAIFLLAKIIRQSIIISVIKDGFLLSFRLLKYFYNF